MGVNRVWGSLETGAGWSGKAECLAKMACGFLDCRGALGSALSALRLGGLAREGAQAPAGKRQECRRARYLGSICIWRTPDCPAPSRAMSSSCSSSTRSTRKRSLPARAAAPPSAVLPGGTPHATAHAWPLASVIASARASLRRSSLSSSQLSSARAAGPRPGLPRSAASMMPCCAPGQG